MPERAELEIVITDNPQNQQRTPVPFVGEQPERPDTVTSPIEPPAFPPSAPPQEVGIVPEPKPAAGKPDAVTAPAPGRPENIVKVGGQRIDINDPAFKGILDFINQATTPQNKPAGRTEAPPLRPGQQDDLFAGATPAADAITDLGKAAKETAAEMYYQFRGMRLKVGEPIDPVAVNKLLRQKEAEQAAMQAEYDNQERAANAIFDVQSDAEKRRMAGVDWFAKNFEGPKDALPVAQPPEAKPIEDPRVLAMRRINAEKQREASERAYNQAKYGQDTNPERDRASAQRGRQQLGSQFTQGGILASVAGFPRVGAIAGATGQMIGATGSMGMAAGGVGLALAVNHAVKGALQDAMQGMSRTAAQAGSLDANVFVDKVQGMNEFFGKLSIGNMAIAETIKGLRGFNDALLATARQLGEYNPTIAMAEAQADIRRTFGDIRRGERLGGGLAKVVDANSRIGEVGRDALTALLKPVLDRLSKWMEKLADMTEEHVVPAAERAGELLDASFYVHESSYQTLRAIHNILTVDFVEAAEAAAASQAAILDAARAIQGNTQPPPAKPFDEDAQFPTLDEGAWRRFGPELHKHHQPQLERRRDQRAFNPVP